VPGLVRRVGGRLLLIDPDGRLLLIHERTDSVAQTQWITPGGGLEPGETPQQAAVREAYEETGIEIALAPDAPAVHSRVRAWRGDGVTFEQTDHFFAVSVPAALPFAPTRLTEVERDRWLGYRWWTVPELHASEETFVPADVAELAAQVVPIRRTAGRVLLLDAAGRVLLIENHTDVGRHGRPRAARGDRRADRAPRQRRAGARRQ
jgi:8-oxo-dGTP pyrophosphatase MutT (NUDIX family)